VYKEFFDIQQKPFSSSPDSHFLFMSQGHSEALVQLRYGLEEEGGFVLLTGEVGTGKTTLCHCLLESASEATAIAYILQPKGSAHELLAAICQEFGVVVSDHSDLKNYVDALYKFLLSTHGDGKSAALIIDEAQNLTVETLEQILLLSNLETNQKKLLQVILLGQPELAVKLRQPELQEVSQLVSSRCHLDPLNAEDTRDYVLHRLAVAQMAPDMFSGAGIKALYKYTAGIPRLIDSVCDRALLAAYSKGVRRVDKALLAVAAKEVLGEKGSVSLPFIPRWFIAGATLAVCITLLFVIKNIPPPRSELLHPKQVAEFVPQLEQVPEVVEQAELEPGIVRQESPVLEKVQEKSLSKKLEPELTQKTVWPTGKALATTEQSAYATLLRLWGLGAPASGQIPCQVARANGFRCLAKQSDLQNILILNRPAVLYMKNKQGKRFFGALVSVQGNLATIEVNGEPVRTNLADLPKLWSGFFVMIWHPPAGYRGSIREGHKGQVVSWLSEKLEEIEGPAYFGESSKEMYGPEHVRSIKHLQRKNHLVPDGVAGKETLIVVNSLSGAQVPYLKKVVQ